MTTIRAAAVIDLRFPASRTLDGSDAMNPDTAAAWMSLPRPMVNTKPQPVRSGSDVDSFR